MIRFLVATIALLGTSTTWAKTPDWFSKNPERRVGNNYEVSCSGRGPSADSARQEAVNSCRASAGLQLQAKVQVKSLSIETEQTTGYHQEVSVDETYEGLDCKALREEVEEAEDHAQVYLRCAFDLSKAKLGSAKVPDLPEKTSSGLVTNAEALRGSDSRTTQNRAPAIENPNTLVLAVVPPCESLMVRGAKSRVLQCAGRNPMPIALDRGDEEVIVRAEGHKPKVIRLSKPQIGGRDEPVEVILDPL